MCEDSAEGTSVGLSWTEVSVFDVGRNTDVVPTFAGGNNRDTEHKRPNVGRLKLQMDHVRFHRSDIFRTVSWKPYVF